MPDPDPPTMPNTSTFLNPSAFSYIPPPAPSTSSSSAPQLLPRAFHKSLPQYVSTPLHPLPTLSTALNLKAVFVKDESSRLGLPAFKILGASWGVFRAVCERAGLRPDPAQTDLEEVGRYARELGITLYAATDGNHGRAVARMGALMGIRSRVFVPAFVGAETRGRIRGEEGAEVVAVDGDYDTAVRACFEACRRHGSGRGLQIQDNGFEGYRDDVPRWIVEGYSTMLAELQEQLAGQGLKASLIVSPVGVGSLAHAVVVHAKGEGRRIRVLTVEPETAACLNASLKAGKPTVVRTGQTIMDGMCCGTVSPVSWPELTQGVDMSVTLADLEVHHAVEYLQAQGIMAGPCGAATLAGLRKAVDGQRAALGLDENAVAVLLCTEGKRDYQVPTAG